MLKVIRNIIISLKRFYDRSSNEKFCKYLKKNPKVLEKSADNINIENRDKGYGRSIQLKYISTNLSASNI